MPRFEYIAIDSAKKTEKGTVTAENAFAARKHLRGRGLHPTDIKQVRMETTEKTVRGLLHRSSKKEVGSFTKELSTMLNAGIKLTEALNVLTLQVTNPAFRTAITEIRDKVVTGESFAESMAEYEQFFDLIYISMVRVGEVTGTLGPTLARMAAFMEKRQRLENKMTTMMIYPAVLMLVCVIVVIVIMIWVIPKITEQLVKTGQKLPFMTRLLMNISELLTSPWVLVVILGIVGLFLLYRRAVKTPKGALWRDKLILNLPGFGPLLKQQILQRFTSTLATLLGSGLSMAESLRVVSQVTGNVIMSDAIKQARERILSGSDISTPLRESGIIDPSTAHMVTVGEKSGELEQMLRMIAENLEASSDIVIERLSAIVEPVIIVFMAIIIGGIAYATLMPLFQYSVTQF
ncbi:MAG: type II secretion system F family protein [Planctomycetaceae bacterium]|nr:type II secretion system F family protein [Planctomycetaceae bacterium]